MKQTALHTVLSIFLALMAARAADVIDRVVARVNGAIILQSDWDEEVCYEAFVEARPIEKFTSADRMAALDRLIDQQLLREQLHMGDTVTTDSPQVRERLSEIRKGYSGAQTDEGWRAALRQYTLTEDQVARRIARQLELMEPVDARLRPGIQVDSGSIENYYRDTFTPQVKSAGAQQAPLSEVSGKIKDLLTEQKVSELLSSWLQTLRSEGQVRTFVSSATAGGQAK